MFTMKITLTAFGIAKDILQSTSKQLDLEGISNVGDLKDYLCREYDAFTKLRSLSFAVGEEYRDDDFSLSDNDEVVIIPPVSGG